MAWKTILKRIAFCLISLGLKSLFNAIDTDNDGKLSKKEIREFKKIVSDKIKSLTN